MLSLGTLSPGAQSGIHGQTWIIRDGRDRMQFLPLHASPSTGPNRAFAYFWGLARPGLFTGSVCCPRGFEWLRATRPAVKSLKKFIKKFYSRS